MTDVWQTNGVGHVTIGGECYDVSPGENFRGVVNRFAKDYGYSNFTVRLDGEKLDQTRAPDEIEGGMEIEIIPKDAGA